MPVPANASLTQINSLLLDCPVSQITSLHQVIIIIVITITVIIWQRRAEKLMSEKRFSEAKVDYQCAIDDKGGVEKHYQ